MPQWLCNQLQRAFQTKDLRQIRVLNDCWFFYRSGHHAQDNQARQADHRS
jgi:hypothetical protein